MKEKKEIPNDLENNSCFVCGPKNPLGFHLRYFKEGEYVISEFRPSEHYCGFEKIFHGGLQCTVLDDLTIWTVMVKRGKMGATKQLTAEFFKPVYIDEKLRIEGKIVKEEGNIFTVEAVLKNGKGKICTKVVSDVIAVNKALFKKLTGWDEIPESWGKYL
ncbi:MAG: PaaI family thioesterase [Candidatus Schekmanbacteria bacterium]|nr:MAG: PaaI family thioesterase [Candidatus Schekmanbacteria bacterium]